MDSFSWTTDGNYESRAAKHVINNKNEKIAIGESLMGAIVVLKCSSRQESNSCQDL